MTTDFLEFEKLPLLEHGVQIKIIHSLYNVRHNVVDAYSTMLENVKLAILHAKIYFILFSP